jgi:hypothetical protein
MSYDCFADEIAIDFPSVETAVERMRDAFLGERQAGDDGGIVRRKVLVSRREASDGRIVRVDVPIRDVCLACGGRGEIWAEPCEGCGGSGVLLRQHALRVALPPGVADGARFRFRVPSPGAESVRVEIRVAITSMNRVIE